MSKLVACVMAGGVGSRFWPASIEERPKQFLDILGLGRTLLQLTYDRYIKLGLAADDVWIITSDRYVDLVSEQLPDVPYSQIIGEPMRKNTAPAAYLGNKLIKEKVGDAIVVMAPSDHHIEDDVMFQHVIRTGQGFLEEVDALITIGIKPDFPHTGYGYIAYEMGDVAPFKVSSFTEKPNLEKATEFINTGGYLWNAGIFMWHVNTLEHAFAKHSPLIRHTIDQHVVSTDGQVVPESLKLAFDQVEDASIDYEIMERADNVYTIPADFKWSDLGSWKSLYDKSTKNEDQNVDLSKESFIENASGNLIFAPGKRVVVKGLKDFMIIEDNDTIVISPLSSNQEVKQWRNHFEE